MLGSYFILTELDEYNELYFEKKANYSDLKMLNNKIVEFYNIDLESNAELIELSKNIEYDEYMLAAQEPNLKCIKYYWWIFVVIGWTGIVLQSILKKKTTHNKK